MLESKAIYPPIYLGFYLALHQHTRPRAAAWIF